MNVFRGFGEVEFDPMTVLTVGSFDGVHRGHRVIVDGLLAQAQRMHARSLIVTFEPHPQEVLRKTGEGVPILTTLEERIEQLELLGVDAVLVLEFTKEFASTPWERFVFELMEHAGVAHIIIGHDHGFGRGREGSSDLLKTFGTEHGFGVTDIGALVVGVATISSTKIRRALLEGDVTTASEYLGRNYAFTGRVVRGDGRGRQIGIPTANIVPVHPHKLIPRNGVYAVTATVDGESYRGMANIGVRPTFTDAEERTIEANLFGFDREIYGSEIRIEFRKFVRFERKFSSKEAFLTQIQHDRKECE